MPPTYDAFISYSHAADGRLAPALQDALQRFAKPWYRRRALHLFRDQTSLSATPGLWPAIEAALTSSRYFLLLASPAAAESRWVQQEVAWWLEHNSPQTMLIGLTDGRIVRPPGGTDFDWAATDALPPNLKGVFVENPLWVDFRWAKGQEQLSTKNPEFQTALAALAAPLRGIPKEDLIGEDVKQHRRALFLARGAAALLALLLIAALAAAGFAFQQRQDAIAQRDEARRQASIAQSRALAAQSENQLDGRLDLGLLLGLEALQAADTDEARASVLAGALANPRLARYLHGGPTLARSVAYSPDGTLIAAVGDSGAVTIWDAASGRPTGPSLVNGFGYSGVAFAPDSRTLAAYGYGVTLWDMATGEPLGPPLARAGQPDSVVDLAFSPDGATLATASVDKQVDLWDVATRQPIGEPLRLEGSFADILAALAFAPDGQTLAIGSRDGTILLWNLATGEPAGEPLAGAGPLNAIAVSADGSTLAAAGDRVVLWDLRTREASPPLVSAVLDANAMFVESFVAFNADGSLLAVATCSWFDGYSECGASDVVLWDVATRSSLGPPLQERGPDLVAVGFTSVAFSPDGTHLATGTTHKGVLLLNVTTDARPAALVRDRSHPASAPGGLTVALSPDGRLLAAPAADDGAIVLWDIAAHREAAALTGHTGFLTALAFSPDGALLASTAGDETRVILWDVATGLQRAELPADRWPGRGLAFSPDGALLAASGDTESGALVWSVADGERREPFVGEQRYALKLLAFSPDGRVLAGAGYDTIELWDVAGRQLLHTLTGHTDEVMSFAFSPDGATLASGGRDNVVRFWDVVSGASVGAPLAGHKASASSALGYTNAGVFALDFTADGRTLVSGGNDGAVILWDVARRQGLGPPLTGHDAPVAAIAFGSDAKTVVSVDWRAVAVTHDVDPESWRTSACRRANRNLSAEEWARYLGDAEYRATCADLPPGNVATPAVPLPAGGPDIAPGGPLAPTRDIPEAEGAVG